MGSSTLSAEHGGDPPIIRRDHIKRIIYLIMAVVVEKTTTTTTTTKQKKSTQYEVNLKRRIYKITALVVVKTTMTKQSTQMKLTSAHATLQQIPLLKSNNFQTISKLSLLWIQILSHINRTTFTRAEHSVLCLIAKRAIPQETETVPVANKFYPC